MATRKAVTRKSLQSQCRDHTETRLFMVTFFSHILITGWNYSFWSDINFHMEIILEFKFDGKTVRGWSKNLQGGPAHHASKLKGFVPRSELRKIGPNEVWFTHGRDHWLLMTLAKSALSHATLQSSSSSWRGGAPALIITSVIISASISPTLLPRVTSSKLMQQHARGEHRPSPGARPSYIRASERTVSTQAAAAESGPWRQPFLAEYAQYLGQDSLCSAQKSALASNIYLNAVDHCGRCTRYVTPSLEHCNFFKKVVCWKPT